MTCPRCKKEVEEVRPSLSRRDNKTRICNQCGDDEAFFDYETGELERSLKDKVDSNTLTYHDRDIAQALVTMKGKERRWLNE